MGRLRPLLLLIALANIAAARPAPDGRPLPKPGPLPPQVLTVYQWIEVLPAPRGGPPGFIFPLAEYTETQPFGCTNLSIEAATRACPGGFHSGLDLADPAGTPIHAASAGIAYPFEDTQRYGNHVIVVHPDGYETVYGHMTHTAVRWGQPVAAGDLIGFVGSTGNSTGPHLHFEIRFAGVPFDPKPYLESRATSPGPLPTGWQGAPTDDTYGLG